MLALLLALGATSQPDRVIVAKAQETAVPSLQALKLLDYSKSDHDDAAALGYSELQELIKACRAYSKGLDALPGFHEPILTRGEAGISIFRKVSPSVVMVVTANFKDD
jgi:hypothetical protein